jgi:hypothetical protein
MTIKASWYWLVLGAALVLVAGCAQPLAEDQGEPGAAHRWKGLTQNGELALQPCGTPQAQNLVAGQNIMVGTVTVSNDSANLYVTYATTGDWRIYEKIHLHVATSVADIPQNGSGNPKIGNFFYQETFSTPVTSATYGIDLAVSDGSHSAWVDGTSLYIAAHAEVVRLDPQSGEIEQSETAWGYGTRFNEEQGSWAMYITYVVQPCSGEPPSLDWLFRTQTQGGWGAPAHGNNPGVYRDGHFPAAFADGLVIGRGDADAATFAAAFAVQNFLPAGGQPAPLGGDCLDPEYTAAGVLAGQVMALALNVGFDLADADFSPYSPDSVHLADLVVADDASPCYGKTVSWVLAEANRILAGLDSSADPALTPPQISDCVARINENFVDGVIDRGFLKLP